MGIIADSRLGYNLLDLWSSQVIYCPNEGIAVQSTYEKLRNSITDDEKVYLGLVRYIDYEKDSIIPGNFLFPFFHKRKSLEHERELRALVIKAPTGKEGLKVERETIVNGLHIRVDVETLIEKIYIAPSAPQWFADVVRTLIQKYGYKFEVVQSQLDAQPLF